MSKFPTYGGASGCSLQKTTLTSLKRNVAANPNGFRVGATTYDTPQQRMWNYSQVYNNAAVKYATTNNVKEAESKLLNLLPVKPSSQYSKDK